jgi:hypothetical protein
VLLDSEEMTETNVGRDLEKAVTAHLLDAGLFDVAVRVTHLSATSGSPFLVSIPPTARSGLETLCRRVLCRTLRRKESGYLIEEADAVELVRRELYFSALFALPVH